MAPWKGTETADIVYDDRGSTLTKHLTDLGHLPSTTTASRTPRYYIEIKTTTSDCKTRFYVSKAQFTRMNRLKQRSGPFDSEKDETYLILRVYKLGQEDMGIRILMDPATMEYDDQLIFEPESYTVSQQ